VTNDRREGRKDCQRHLMKKKTCSQRHVDEEKTWKSWTTLKSMIKEEKKKKKKRPE
jgi:hypothetical protein